MEETICIFCLPFFFFLKRQLETISMRHFFKIHDFNAMWYVGQELWWCERQCGFEMKAYFMLSFEQVPFPL